MIITHSGNKKYRNLSDVVESAILGVKNKFFSDYTKRFRDEFQSKPFKSNFMS